jgi:hypothetical protein
VVTSTKEETNREILDQLLGGDTFLEPAQEYEYRTKDFEARMPQTGEWFDRDSLMAMQTEMGAPPAVRVERITGSGDLWVVETINTYADDGDYFACVIVEFVDGKIRRETRYYGREIEVARRPKA